MEQRVFPSQNRASRLGRLREQRRRLTERVAGTPSGQNPSSPSNNKVRPLRNRKDPRTTPALRRAPKAWWEAMLWFCFRAAVGGIGLSMIAGTLIAFWNGYATSGNASGVMAPNPTKRPNDDGRTTREFLTSRLKGEASALKTKIAELSAGKTDLALQVMVYDIDTGVYVDINAAKPIASASTIKIPLLVAFLQDVDAGRARLDEQMEITKDVLVGESGELQYQPIGTKLPALEVLTKMIIISDNTATNMILKKIGGKEAANQRFLSWGLTSTAIRNPLPDLEGTNTVTPRDLVQLLALVEQGKLLKPRSRDRLFDIMHRTETNTLIPQGIGDERVRIAHKTGDIRSVVGDAGIVDMPDGKRYVMSAMVKRPDNDQNANELIRQVSRAVYEFLGQSTPAVPSVQPAGTQPPTTGTTTSPDTTAVGQ